MDECERDENREFIRAPLVVPVEFRALDQTQYLEVREGRLRGLPAPVVRSGAGEEPPYPPAASGDSELVKYLMYLDEKLDRILDLLCAAGERKGNRKVQAAQGIDINCKGMRIRCDAEMTPGQILDTHFVLSRYPLVSLNLFGQVTRATALGPEQGGQWELAVQFLDMGEQETESIMAYVFRMQRETIRKARMEKEAQ